MVKANRTTVDLRQYPPLCEKITHDLKHDLSRAAAARNSRKRPMDGDRGEAIRHSTPAAVREMDLLKEGRLQAVVTSTSLELGVDIGTADLASGGFARRLGACGAVGTPRLARLLGD